LHGYAADEEDMRILGAALTKLSRSVESTVRYKTYPEDIGERDLLARATAHSPAQLEPFADYAIRINRVGKDSSVLVCDREETTGLLEDAGCTGRLDANLWQAPTRPCEFTLDVTKICSVPQ